MSTSAAQRPASLAGASTPSAVRRIGLLCLVATTLGWGLNWPIAKVLLAEWPPLTARAISGITAGIALALIARARGESLAIPPGMTPRLLLASATNVTAWMGFATLGLAWLNVAEAALLTYTMPLWVAVFAWPLLGEKPGWRGIVALLLGLLGLVVLFAGRGGVALSAEKLPGVAAALAAALCFALGSVLTRGKPTGLAPVANVAWQVGLGCAVLAPPALLLESVDVTTISPAAWAALGYMTAVAMGVCYITWFAALERLPPSTASIATLLTPPIGIGAAALALGEPVGLREAASLALVLTGVTLAMRAPAK